MYNVFILGGYELLLCFALLLAALLWCYIWNGVYFNVDQPSPQEVRRTLMRIFVVTKRRYYTSVRLLGPETLVPID